MRRALPFAAAAAAAAADERRTGSLNPPGLSRGGLKRKYEQVKVFRNGDSLFQCAFLAELVSRHEDDVFEDDAELKAFDRRDRAAARRAETVAAVLRRGIRALGSADTHETTLALRAGAASRIAEALRGAWTRARADLAPPGANPRRRFATTSALGRDRRRGGHRRERRRAAEQKHAFVPAARRALDTWRRAMNEVGRRAEAELPEEAADALLDDDERLESDDESLSRADDEASRLERRAAFESAVRNVRRAYADEVARARVPSSSLEVDLALAAHLRRPIAVIRGPSRPLRAATKKGIRIESVRRGRRRGARRRLARLRVGAPVRVGDVRRGARAPRPTRVHGILGTRRERPGRLTRGGLFFAAPAARGRETPRAARTARRGTRTVLLFFVARRVARSSSFVRGVGRRPLQS